MRTTRCSFRPRKRETGRVHVLLYVLSHCARHAPRKRRVVRPRNSRTGRFQTTKMRDGLLARPSIRLVALRLSRANQEARCRTAKWRNGAFSDNDNAKRGLRTSFYTPRRIAPVTGGPNSALSDLENAKERGGQDRAFSGRTTRNGAFSGRCEDGVCPSSSELGTHAPVRARFWPWLEPCSVQYSCEPFR